MLAIGPVLLLLICPLFIGLWGGFAKEKRTKEQHAELIEEARIAWHESEISLERQHKRDLEEATRALEEKQQQERLALMRSLEKEAPWKLDQATRIMEQRHKQEREQPMWEFEREKDRRMKAFNQELGRKVDDLMSTSGATAGSLPIALLACSFFGLATGGGLFIWFMSKHREWRLQEEPPKAYFILGKFSVPFVYASRLLVPIAGIYYGAAHTSSGSRVIASLGVWSIVISAGIGLFGMVMGLVGSNAFVQRLWRDGD